MKLIENLGNGNFRETEFDAPVNETDNARTEQVGPFRQDTAAASQSNVALTLAAVDANAPTGWRAGRAGNIVGIVWDLSAAPTAGTGTLTPVVAGTVQTAAAVSIAGAQNGETDLPGGPVAFAAGVAVGLDINTNSAWSPATSHLRAWLLVKWTYVDDDTAQD